MTARLGELEARRLSVAIDGGEAAVLRFGRKGGAPLLFAHANGFCASAYARMFEAMDEVFDIFAVDLRGHGRTRLSAEIKGHRSMALFGEDIRLMKSALAPLAGEARWTLAGHSLGAVAALVAAGNDGAVSAVRLIEPVAAPALWRILARSAVWPQIAPRLPLVRGAMRRRDQWPDRASVEASYAGKPFFAGWAEGVLADYLADGLTPDGAGVRLSCTPRWEAANFAAQAVDLRKAIRRTEAPVGVLAARHSSSTLFPGAEAQLRRAGAVIERQSGVTHLLPFEAPALAARFLVGSPR